jgi:hypothetical protein
LLVPGSSVGKEAIKKYKDIYKASCLASALWNTEKPQPSSYIKLTHQPKKFLPHIKRVEDIRGQLFGNYTVLEFAGLAPTNRVSKWLCRCVCGAEHVVFKTALRPGHIYCPTCHRSNLPH